MPDSELWRLGAIALASAIRDREVTAREVLDAHLDRIDAVNGDVNAVVRRSDEEARAAADEADRKLASGSAVGPLHGVPVSLKVNVDIAGQPSDQGLAVLADVVVAEDAPVTAHLRRAGAIFHARGNMPDLGMRWNTENPLHGPTRNVWNAGRTAGGSSGGDAAAVAAGMAPLAVGNDFGGSLRVPAAYNGVMTLRPTPGRIPVLTEGDEDRGVIIQWVFTDGPIARSAEDLEVAFRIMSQNDPRDPEWVDASHGPDGPCKVLVVREVPGVDHDPEVLAGIDAAAAALVDAGYEIEYGAPPKLTEVAELWRDLTATEVSRFVGEEQISQGSEQSQRWVRAFLEESRLFEAREFSAALARRSFIAMHWSQQMVKTPLILAAVDPEIAWPVDMDREGDINAVFRSLGLRYQMNFSGSLLGTPSVTMPVGVGESRMPRAVQLVSWRHNEQRALTAAKAVEAAFPAVSPIDPRPAAPIPAAGAR